MPETTTLNPKIGSPVHGASAQGALDIGQLVENFEPVPDYLAFDFGIRDPSYVKTDDKQVREVGKLLALRLARMMYEGKIPGFVPRGNSEGIMYSPDKFDPQSKDNAKPDELLKNSPLRFDARYIQTHDGKWRVNPSDDRWEDPERRKFDIFDLVAVAYFTRNQALCRFAESQLK
ncbi:hypothetical protein HYU14_04325 [Candidatus Woesearchaeota archaeon]|nr:hypothetical protein [Candidatus Woesearchaeota archaeon]